MPERPIGMNGPFYFPSQERRLFGWLHRDRGGAMATTGLVICQPFGYESICGHRSMRAFAETVAGAGIPVLRFDYAGTGDASDLEPAADQIETWVNDIEAAVRALRQHAGVRRVCLLGFRLGALLATLAAGRGAQVEALLLVAPVIDGRRYLRELRTTALAGSAGLGAPRSAGDGALEAGGFLLSGASVARLSAIDLTRLTEAPAPEVLIIDRDDLSTARAWSESLAKIGVRTCYQQVPGFIRMMMTPPQFAAVPQGMVDAVREWLQQRAQRQGGSGVAPAAGIEGGEATSELALPGATSPESPALHESPVVIEAEPTLFGIITAPLTERRRRRAVVLLNSGADYHIGAGRMYVNMARRWAAHGYVVLRMDLRGLGDSATRPGCKDDEVFPPGAIEDIGIAVDFVRRNYGVREVTLAGLCSAGYHVLRAAVAGLPVNRILMVNPQNFSWMEGMTVGAIQLADVVKELRGGRRRRLSFATLKRLLAGQVDVATVARIYLQRTRMFLESVVREAARRLHIRLPRDLGWELQDIAARGVRVVFVFAAGDPGIDLLRLQGGSVVGRLGERCRVHIIESADHTFTGIAGRARMEQVLSEELLAPPQCS